jgi:hypothetical protein
MSFNESISKYRSVYFYFLDGLLNTTLGGNFTNVLSTLKDIVKYTQNDYNIGELIYKSETINFGITLKIIKKTRRIFL